MSDSGHGAHLALHQPSLPYQYRLHHRLQRFALPRNDRLLLLLWNPNTDVLNPSVQPRPPNQVRTLEHGQTRLRGQHSRYGLLRFLDHLFAVPGYLASHRTEHELCFGGLYWSHSVFARGLGYSRKEAIYWTDQRG